MSWVLPRAALYGLVAIIAIPGGGYVYDDVNGSSRAGSSGSAADLFAWLHVGVVVAVLGGGTILVVLAFVSPFRSRLTAITIKSILMPFLLLPVLFVDLAGTTPSFTLWFLGMQVLYLIIVPVGRVRSAGGGR